MKNKHLTYEDRLQIESSLKDRFTFQKIANLLTKDSTTISKEIRNHYIVKRTGAYGRPFLDCKNRIHCPFREKGMKCNSTTCNHYQKEPCHQLMKPPYVCNGCSKKAHCTLEKHIYSAADAQKEYEEIRKESRSGITYTEEELHQISQILKPLIVDQKQSVHHALIENKNRILVSEKEIYRLIDLGVLEIANIDLPKKVRYRLRPKNKTSYKIDKHCLENRKYTDYQKYMEEHPDENVVEMDSVEGIKGGKVLLTLHFRNCHFMLAFLRDRNDAQSVINIFQELEKILGLETFQKLFPVILTDNGSEFSNPLEIEFNKDGVSRTKVFYCEPGRPDQKGSCEGNHQFIRRVYPKRTSFDSLTQQDITNLMSHINSYKRKKLNDCNPLQLFNLMYGKEIANQFGIIELDTKDINLSSSRS